MQGEVGLMVSYILDNCLQHNHPKGFFVIIDPQSKTWLLSPIAKYHEESVCIKYLLIREPIHILCEFCLQFFLLSNTFAIVQKTIFKYLIRFLWTHYIFVNRQLWSLFEIRLPFATIMSQAYCFGALFRVMWHIFMTSPFDGQTATYFLLEHQQHDWTNFQDLWNKYIGTCISPFHLKWTESSAKYIVCVKHKSGYDNLHLIDWFHDWEDCIHDTSCFWFDGLVSWLGW